MKNFGYVLSGGGARGFAHLGVMKFLEESGIRPFAISGTSAGAIAGALYAAGKNAEEILKLMKDSSYFGWSNLLWRKKGFFSMNALDKLLRMAIPEDDFSTVGTRLFVVATDLVKGEAVLFSKGPLYKAVIASASVPVVFEPVTIGDMVLVDGGVLNNFPVEPLVGLCDYIIGSNVNKLDDGISKDKDLRTVQVIDRCFHLAISANVHDKAAACDVFIESPLNSFDMYDVKKADQIFDIGYQSAKLHSEKLKELAAS